MALPTLRHWMPGQVGTMFRPNWGWGLCEVGTEMGDSVLDVNK